MQKLGFYPGCSLKGSSREYSESVLAIAKKFEIDLVEIPDWNCCGASAAHNLNKELATSLPARILALAEKAGLDEIVVPCAACYSKLSVTQHDMNENFKLRSKVTEILEMEYKGKTKILNIIQFIDKYIIKDIDYKLEFAFNHKVACYYGCLLVRPHKILKFDRPEDPQTMDVVMKKLGADPVEWNFKNECCGAGFSVSKTDAVNRLCGNILQDAIKQGAEAMIVACPMCHSNLDMRRPGIDKYLNQKTEIPVIYITQAIGMATGIDAKELGLERHFVPVNIKLAVNN